MPLSPNRESTVIESKLRNASEAKNNNNNQKWKYWRNNFWYYVHSAHTSTIVIVTLQCRYSPAVALSFSFYFVIVVSTTYLMYSILTFVVWYIFSQCRSSWENETFFESIAISYFVVEIWSEKHFQSCLFFFFLSFFFSPEPFVGSGEYQWLLRYR